MRAAISSEAFTGARPVSASPLWNLLRANYESCGTEAWDSGTIPAYVTSNASVAHRYAHVISAWLRDLEDARTIRPGDTARVLELGCGTGRFTFHLASSLEELNATPILQRHPWQYLATDVSAKRLQDLEQVAPLKRFFTDGRLRTFLYDAMAGDAPDWTGQPDSPLVVIANYVLDSLPADFFRVQDGELYETLIELRGAESGSEPRPESGPHLSLHELSWNFSHRPAAPGYYSDEILDGILDREKACPAPRSIIFPTGAVQAIRNLRGFTAGPILMLIADKANRVPAEMAELAMPVIERHGASHFSVALDFDLLAQVAQADGGHMLVSTHGHEVISFAALISGVSNCRFAETNSLFADLHERFAMHSELYLAARLGEQAQVLSLHDHLAWLRMSHFDPHNWSSVFPLFARQVAAAPPELRPELVETLERVSARWFPASGEQFDTPFLVGSAFLLIGHAEAARRHLARSIEECGLRPAAQFQMGRAEALCGGRLNGARHMREALTSEPTLGRTLEFLGLLPDGEAQAKQIAEQMEWQASLPPRTLIRSAT